MAETTFKTITGTGAVASTDYHVVKWEGFTKAGKKVRITLLKALNMGNIDLAFAEKNDTVAQVVYTSVYDNTDTMLTNAQTAEPWKVEYETGVVSGAGEILLGAGLMYVDDAPIALTRGGGAFSVNREFRRINADGDRGAVEGRINIDASEATLTVNTLQIIAEFPKLYAGVSVA